VYTHSSSLSSEALWRLALSDDLIGGALIGVCAGYVATHWRRSEVVSSSVVRWSTRNAAWFYVLSFLLLYEFIEMFDTARASFGTWSEETDGRLDIRDRDSRTIQAAATFCVACASTGVT